jgi:hypothetical protein
MKNAGRCLGLTHDVKPAAAVATVGVGEAAISAPVVPSTDREGQEKAPPNRGGTQHVGTRGGRLSFSLHVSNTVLVLIAQAKRLTSG